MTGGFWLVVGFVVLLCGTNLAMDGHAILGTLVELLAVTMAVGGVVRIVNARR